MKAANALPTALLLAALAALGILAAAPVLAQEAPSFRLSGEVRAEAAYNHESTASAYAGLTPFEEVTAAGTIEGKLAFSRQYTTLGLLDFTFQDENLLSHLDGSGLETLSFTVNELYADLNFSDLLFLRLGKQRLKWGAGYVFNPSDPVNPPKDPTAARPVREGVSALKAELISSAVSLMTFGVLYDAIEHTGAGGRLSTSAVPNTDLSLSAYGSASESWTVALNASVAPLYALPGWDTLQLWFEGSLYERSAELKYNLLAGGTAQLPVIRTVLLTEYYHLSVTQAGLPGQEGADYLFLSLSQPTVTDSGHPVFDKIGLQASCLLDLTDRSFYLSGGITTAFVEDSSVELSASWAHGGQDTEFGNAPADLTATLTVRVFF
jgi:hypothetical protein